MLKRYAVLSAWFGAMTALTCATPAFTQERIVKITGFGAKEV